MHSQHQNFLKKYALPDEHYTIDNMPLLYAEKQLPKDQLDKLVYNKSTIVRQYAATNPNLHTEHYKSLAKDGDPMVRASLVDNKNLPAEFVIEYAKTFNKDLNKYLHYKYILSNEKIPSDLINEIFKNVIKTQSIEEIDRRKILALIAKNPNLDKAHLNFLATYHKEEVDNESVRRGALSNKNINREYVIAALQDKDRRVRDFAHLVYTRLKYDER